MIKKGNKTMSRLDRILDLLNRYDDYLSITLRAYHNGTLGFTILAELRQEKEQLTQELIEHGCRRKN